MQDSRTQLFVSNLPFRVRWQDLVRALGKSVFYPSEPLLTWSRDLSRAEGSHAKMWHSPPGEKGCYEKLQRSS